MSRRSARLAAVAAEKSKQVEDAKQAEVEAAALAKKIEMAHNYIDSSAEDAALVLAAAKDGTLLEKSARAAGEPKDFMAYAQNLFQARMDQCRRVFMRLYELQPEKKADLNKQWQTLLLQWMKISLWQPEYLPMADLYGLVPSKTIGSLGRLLHQSMICTDDAGSIVWQLDASYPTVHADGLADAWPVLGSVLADAVTRALLGTKVVIVETDEASGAAMEEAYRQLLARLQLSDNVENHGLSDVLQNNIRRIVMPDAVSHPAHAGVLTTANTYFKALAGTGFNPDITLCSYHLKAGYKQKDYSDLLSQIPGRLVVVPQLAEGSGDIQQHHMVEALSAATTACRSRLNVADMAAASALVQLSMVAGAGQHNPYGGGSDEYKVDDSEFKPLMP